MENITGSIKKFEKQRMTKFLLKILMCMSIIKMLMPGICGQNKCLGGIGGMDDE